MITEPEKTYEVDAFTATPACLVSYSYLVSPTSALVSFDEITRTFAFEEAKDLTQTDTKGPNYFKDYIVTIIAKSGSLT